MNVPVLAALPSPADPSETPPSGALASGAPRSGRPASEGHSVPGATQTLSLAQQVQPAAQGQGRSASETLPPQAAVEARPKRATRREA